MRPRLILEALTHVRRVRDVVVYSPTADNRGRYAAEMSARLPEVPIEALRGNRLVVDSREAALREAGELVSGIAAGQLDETAIAAELGEILLGRAPGRERPDEICLFKSTGLAVQDLVTARAVLAAALTAGAGTRVAIQEGAE